MLARLAFRLARSYLGNKVVGWTFGKMNFLLPIKRLRDTKRLVAFHHPKPAYPLHILIVPKQQIPGLQALTPADGDLLAEVIQMTQSLVNEFGLEQSGFRLVVNGGEYQELPQLHFHLISESFKNPPVQAPEENRSRAQD